MQALHLLRARALPGNTEGTSKNTLSDDGKGLAIIAQPESPEEAEEDRFQLPCSLASYRTALRDYTVTLQPETRVHLGVHGRA